MKSSVFGAGRNRKHRPKGAPNDPAAANINMRGKKCKRMNCGCCYAVDLRSTMIDKIHSVEMREYE